MVILPFDKLNAKKVFGFIVNDFSTLLQLITIKRAVSERPLALKFIDFQFSVDAPQCVCVRVCVCANVRVFVSILTVVHSRIHWHFNRVVWECLYNVNHYCFNLTTTV